ncbi:GntR family transcriptional regulator [Salmonella enterica subsp. enterica serovar Choleraesuis]|nr:GntR family transcriptional regulator [Salmonella enterica subsp. enterica serovar Choleraesuis]
MNQDITPGILALDPSAAEPFYRQIYERFRYAIAQGVLKPGQRIPSARALAKELGLARGTVDSAYSLLAAEGYIQPRGQAGTVVSADLKPVSLPVTPPARPRIAAPASFRPDSVLPFQMGLPALDAFPRKIWARLAARAARSMQFADMAHPDVLGLPALRTQIASYLQVSRGIACSPQQVFLTAGYRQSIELIRYALLQPGDQVWLENPGYPPSQQLLERMQIATVPVAVDSEGIDVAAGIAAAPYARAAVVTPAHQSPLCVSLSLPRRQALLEWAGRSNAWIIEDDYDGEYRYVGRPLPALKSLDRPGRVIYSGTFSKVLFPGIRLAYLVVPQPEVARFEEIASIFGCGFPALTQEIVAAFMAEGHFARHIVRMRKLYGERRERTAAGLEKVLGARMTIDAQPGGMHLILRLRQPISDRLLADKMRDSGLFADALSEWIKEGERPQALLLNFTNVESQLQAETLAGRILQLM